MAHCEHCNKDFSSDEAYNQHTKSKHAEQYKEKFSQRHKKKVRNWLILLIILGLVIWGITALVQRDKKENEGLNFEPPQGVIHWHPELTIIIDGVKQVIPANIGLGGSVHSPIHTHDEDAAEGVLHIETDNPTKQTVILGYFFNVWGKKFSKDCIFDYCTDRGTLKMTVNGKENYDYGKFFMHDGDNIVIEYASNTSGATNSSSVDKKVS